MTKSKQSTQTRNNSKLKVPVPAGRQESLKFERVLAVDPGFDRIGVAVMEKDEVLFSTCIVTERTETHEDRLRSIGNSLGEIIKDWSPSELAIETLFFNQNVSTAIKVAEARGVTIYESVRAGLKVFEYSPQAIKIAVTGYGKADKRQVENMVQKLVKMPVGGIKKLDDELDAIALGITHLASRKSI